MDSYYPKMQIIQSPWVRLTYSRYLFHQEHFYLPGWLIWLSLRAAFLVSILILVGGAAHYVQAQVKVSRLSESLPSPWSGHVSVGAMYGPKFLGSGDYGPKLGPGFELTYRNRYFLSLRRGIGALITHKGSTIGASLSYQPGRDQDDSDALNGLGDVSSGAAGNIFGSFMIVDPVHIGLSVQQGLIGTDNLVISSFLEAKFRLSRRLFSQHRFSASYANEDHMQDYFGITADQARRSGLPSFDAEASLRDVSFSTGLRWDMTTVWSVLGNGEYSRLIGDAAKSPLVKKEGSRNQWRAGLSILYQFSL